MDDFYPTKSQLGEWYRTFMDIVPKCDLHTLRYELKWDGSAEPVMGIGLSKDKTIKIGAYTLICIGKIGADFNFKDDFSDTAFHFLIQSLSRLQNNIPSRDKGATKNYYANQIRQLCQIRGYYVYDNCHGEDADVLNEAFRRWNDSLSKALDQCKTPEALAQAEKNQSKRISNQEKAFRERFEAKREETIEFLSEFILLYELTDKPEIAKFLLGAPLEDICRYLKSRRALRPLVDDERLEQGLQLALVRSALES